MPDGHPSTLVTFN